MTADFSRFPSRKYPRIRSKLSGERVRQMLPAAQPYAGLDSGLSGDFRFSIPANLRCDSGLARL